MKPKVRKSSVLTPKQLQFIELLADPASYNMTREQIAKKLGVKVRTIDYWRQNIPDLWERVYEIAQREVKRYIPKILDTIAKKAADGDIQAARLLFEHLGKITQKVEVSVKLPQVFVELYEQRKQVIVNDSGEE